jgi:hypothetical protein
MIFLKRISLEILIEKYFAFDLSLHCTEYVPFLNLSNPCNETVQRIIMPRSGLIN